MSCSFSGVTAGLERRRTLVHATGRGQALDRIPAEADPARMAVVSVECARRARDRLCEWCTRAPGRRPWRRRSAARVRIVGLPVAVIDDTVRVEVDGPAIATSVRTGVDAPAAADAAAEESRRSCARRGGGSALAEAEVERLDGALERLGRRAARRGGSDATSRRRRGRESSPRGARVVALRAERELALRERARGRAARARRGAARARGRGRSRSARRHGARGRGCTSCASTSSSSCRRRGDGAIAIHLEYQVARGALGAELRRAARRRAGRAFEVRAVVAQDTGEDWTGVPLRLSTAEPERFAPLPELARAADRPPPARAGARRASARRRPAPRRCTPTTTAGVSPAAARRAAADVHRAEPVRGRDVPGADAGPRRHEAAVRGGVGRGVVAREGGVRHAGGRHAAAWRPRMAPPQAAARNAPRDAAGTPRARTSTRSPGPVSRGADADAAPRRCCAAYGLGGAAPSRYAPRAPPPAPPAARLDYGNLRMAPPTSPQRGTLVPRRRDRHAAPIAQRASRRRRRGSTRCALPPGCVGGLGAHVRLRVRDRRRGRRRVPTARGTRSR